MTQYRLIGAVFGLMLATLAHSTILDRFDNEQTGYVYSALLLVAIFLPAIWLCCYIVPERASVGSPPVNRIGFRHGVRIAWQNKPFGYLMVTGLCTFLCNQLLQTNLILYVKYVREGPDIEYVIVLIVVELTMILALVLWSRLSYRYGKRAVFFVGTSFFIMATSVMFFRPKSSAVEFYASSVFIGAGMAAGLLIPWSMLPDVVELDELETGYRREGAFYSFFAFSQKVVASAALSGSHYALGFASYDPTEEDTSGDEDEEDTQTDAVVWALRVLFTILPACIMTLSYFAMLRYPLTESQLQEISNLLQQKKDSRMRYDYGAAAASPSRIPYTPPREQNIDNRYHGAVLSDDLVQDE